MQYLRISFGLPIYLFVSQYRPDFPSSIKEHAVFVDLAPRFHVMAEDILQGQIQLVISNLKQVKSLKSTSQLRMILI